MHQQTWLYSAGASDRVVVLHKLRAKKYGLCLWNLDEDTVVSGSIFTGRICWYRCDVSPDGTYFVYEARGAAGKVWTGICHPPRLRAVVNWPEYGIPGGGYWLASNCVVVPKIPMNANRHVSDGVLPFAIHEMASDRLIPSELSVLAGRFRREGWSAEAPVGRWCIKPSPEHPSLFAVWDKDSNILLFSLETGKVDLTSATSVTWSSRGLLLVGRPTQLETYSLADISVGKPHRVHSIVMSNP